MVQYNVKQGMLDNYLSTVLNIYVQRKEIQG